MQTSTKPESQHNWEPVGRRVVDAHGCVTVNRRRYFVSATLEQGTQVRIYRDAQGLAAITGQSLADTRIFRLQAEEVTK